MNETWIGRWVELASRTTEYIEAAEELTQMVAGKIPGATNAAEAGERLVAGIRRVEKARKAVREHMQEIAAEADWEGAPNGG